MLYKNGKKFIFVHIPKNAGNTIRHSILQLPNDDVELESHLENGVEYRSINNQHLTYDEHLDKYKEFNSENLFSFCFIRNPYTRFISTFNYLSDERFLSNGSYIRRKTSELFLNLKSPLEVLKFLDNNRNHEFFKDKHGYLQSDFIGIDKKVDYIGLVENFDNDIISILTRIGIQQPILNKKLNTSNNKFINLVTDKRYIKLIDKIYGSDLRFYQRVVKNKKLI